MRVGSVVRITANGNIARGTQGGLSGEVRRHTEESDDSIPVGNTELASHSRTAFLQSEVYTAATVLGRTKTQGIRPTSGTAESAYRISYDLEAVGLGTRPVVGVACIPGVATRPTDQGNEPVSGFEND